jgi:hypothetical protein
VAADTVIAAPPVAPPPAVPVAPKSASVLAVAELPNNSPTFTAATVAVIVSSARSPVWNVREILPELSTPFNNSVS